MPWVGSYLFVVMLNSDHMHRALEAFSKFYKSTVLGLYLGRFPTIAITDLENTKKALNHRDFDGRPDFLIIRLRHPTFDPVHGL